MITLTITIRQGMEKIGVAVQMKGMKTATEEELEEFEEIYHKLISRPNDLAKAQVKGFLTGAATGKIASDILKKRVENL